MSSTVQYSLLHTFVWVYFFAVALGGDFSITTPFIGFLSQQVYSTIFFFLHSYETAWSNQEEFLV